MHRQVEAEEKRLDQALLHHNLIEVGQHIVDTGQVRHKHFESKRLGDIHDWNVNLVGSAQVWAFVALVSTTQGAQNRFLRPLVSLPSVSIDDFATLRAARLRNVALSDSRFHSDNFIVDVVLRSD